MAKLRAVVVGAGWAGEGQTKALQWCGVDVAAICARQPEVVRKVADGLGVAEASTDWAEAIRRLRPAIVSIATPATLRGEVVEAAIAIGAHVFCDKPLAVDGAEAGRLYHLVDSASIKHAYGVTQRYDPSVAWLAELVREGRIGRLREVTGSSRGGFPPLMPWCWALVRALGGGALNNTFTHRLAALAAILDGPPVQVMGEARVVRDRAPVVKHFHDIRETIPAARALTPEEAAALEWRSVDGEDAFSALLRFRTPGGEVPVAFTAGPGVPAAGEASGLRLYGDEGTLEATGGVSYAVALTRRPGELADPLPVPERLLAELPDVGNDLWNKWAALLRDFVADVRGEPRGPYPTFRDGWSYQVAIDAIRAGKGWIELPV